MGANSAGEGRLSHIVLESAALKRLQPATNRLLHLPAVRQFQYELMENIIQSHGNRP
jgi:hypothetical protein